MVSAPKKNLSPLLLGTCGNLTQRSTWWHHQTNEEKSGLDTETVRALSALRSLRPKQKLAVEKRRETHFLSNEDKEKWIKYYVDRETTVARKLVEDAVIVIKQKKDDMRNAEKAAVTTRKPEATFQEMFSTIGDNTSDLASSEDGKDGEGKDNDEADTELGKLSDDDEPSWVMGIFSKMVQHHMGSFRQKQIISVELM